MTQSTMDVLKTKSIEELRGAIAASYNALISNTADPAHTLGNPEADIHELFANWGMSYEIEKIVNISNQRGMTTEKLLKKIEQTQKRVEDDKIMLTEKQVSKSLSYIASESNFSIFPEPEQAMWFMGGRKGSVRALLKLLSCVKWETVNDELVGFDFQNTD